MEQQTTSVPLEPEVRRGLERVGVVAVSSSHLPSWALLVGPKHTRGIDATEPPRW